MYIPLYNKSNYSLLSSLLKIDDIIKYATTNHLSSVAITDFNMFGTMDFIKKCEKVDIKPIIGLEVKIDNNIIVLYAKNYIGYCSLIKLATIQSERKVLKEDLITNRKELIAVIPFEYKEIYQDMGTIFLDIYLGFQNNQEEKESLIITNNCVFFRESLYYKKEDEEFLSYLYRIRDGKTILDKMDYQTAFHELEIDDISFLSDEKGLKNTKIIADNCNIIFPKYENLLPIYECNNPDKYLFDLSRAGLKKRLQKEIPNNYKERLIKELNTIVKMGFSNYFLIVYDYIKDNKDKLSLNEDEIKFMCKVISSHMGEWNTSPYSDVVLPLPKDKYQRFLHMCDFLASRKFLDIKFENNDIVE